MEHLSYCLLCGDDREDCYHVVMQCPHAVNLHAAMRLRWCLPAERELKFTGPEWLLGIVDTQPVEQVACLLLIFWRAWFIRNEPTHSNKKLSLEGSVSFLENYWMLILEGVALNWVQYQNSHGIEMATIRILLFG